MLYGVNQTKAELICKACDLVLELGEPLYITYISTDPNMLDGLDLVDQMSLEPASGVQFPSEPGCYLGLVDEAWMGSEDLESCLRIEPHSENGAVVSNFLAV